MSITLPGAMGGRRVRSIGAFAGLAISSLMAIALTATGQGQFGLACIPVSGLAGWLLAPLAIGSGRAVALSVSALAFGVLVGFGGVTAYVLVAQFAALLPGADVALPETPVGYLLFLVISLVTLGPFVSVAFAAVGLAWAAIVRFATRGGR